MSINYLCDDDLTLNNCKIDVIQVKSLGFRLCLHYTGSIFGAVRELI